MTRRLKGLFALLLILVLLVGIPVGLYVAGGAPWPDHVPSLTAIKDALLAPDNGSAFMAVLKVVGWLAWLSFAVMLVLEVGARLNGTTIPPIRGFRIQQRAAAGLVTAAALLFTVAAPVALAAPAGAAVDHQPVGHAITQTVDRGVHVETATSGIQVHQGVKAATPVPEVAVHAYEVQPGDSLFSIAEKMLGNGDRFKEIAALNYGVQQDDGSALTASHWLAPGWTLKVPVDHEAAPTVEHVTVKPGDTLSEIAQKTLGDAGRYDEIAQATRHVDQPGGEHLTDPDLIKPGWTLDVPVAHADQPTGGDTHDVSTPTHREASVQEHTGLPDAMVQAAIADHAAHTGGGGAGGGAHAAEQDRNLVAASVSDSGFSTGATAALGGFLAAGLLGAVGIARLRRRDTADPVTPAPDPEPVEELLAAASAGEAVAQVDRALRSLADACRRESRPLPVVRAARLVGARLELFLDGAAVLPTPWAGASGATVWSGRVDSAELLDAAAAADVAAPYPSLVTVGRDHEGSHLFVDLAHIGTLGVVGPGSSVRGVLAAIAAELGTLPWSSDVRVTVVGAFRDLSEHLGGGRLRYLASAEMVLDELATRPADAGREVVLLAAEATADQRSRLAQAVERTPGVALVAASIDDVVGRWALRLERGGMAMLQPLGLPVIPQELDGPTYDDVLAVLATAQAPTMIRTLR